MRTLALPSLVLLLLSIPAGTAVGVDVAVILSADVGAYRLEAPPGLAEILQRNGEFRAGIPATCGLIAMLACQLSGDSLPRGGDMVRARS